MKKYLHVAILALFFPVLVFSAEFTLESPPATGVGDEFPIILYLNSEKSINAVEGRVIFPADLLELKSINTGNSAINFWIDGPKIDSPNAIFFSGITPGGIIGENNLIFKIIFKAKKTGGGLVSLSEAKALLNDGEGAEDSVIVKKIDISINDKISSNPFADDTDTELPESFRPEIGRDQFIFDRKWFVVFSTQDKNSGIKSYMIKESRQKALSFIENYDEAQSPHVLKDQDLRSYIFIKAIDNAGNERVEEISPRYPLPWYQNSSSWITIITILLVLWVIKKWKKKRIKRE